jgi:multidrug efflux system membrane fusion protein
MDENKHDPASPETPASATPASPAAPRVPPVAPAPPRNKRRRVITGIIVVLVIVAIALIVIRPWGSAKVHEARGGRRGGPGPMSLNQAQAVRVAKAVIGEIPIVKSALGTVTPLATVTVRTQIAGTLMSIGFTEGQHVHKGDFLAQVDPRPYEIQLRQAEGTLKKDQALLAQAKLDLQRYKTLLAQDSVARQTYDDQVSLVQQYTGTVISDQAAIDTYKLDLTYAHIVAPVDGRVGLRQVDVGNYVQTGDTNGVVVITQMQPMSVLFTLPEDDLRAVLKRVATGATLSASAYDRTNTTQIALGALSNIDNQIDTATGTIKLRAMFANKDEALFPNQFVNVRLLVDVLRNAVIVPSSAIQTGSIGSYVYVAKPDNTVTVRKVTVGPVDGERTAVTAGVEAGETVVIDGIDRLREGSAITIPAESGAAGASGASGAAAASASTTGPGGMRHASGAWAASGASGAAHHRRRPASDAQ